jgi:hypothetical protein
MVKSKSREKYLEGKEAIIEYPEVPTLRNTNLPDIDADDTIEQMFKNEQINNQNDVKEIFAEEKVKARTDISPRQVRLITKAFYLAEITGMKEIHSILKDFLTLSISKDRKSRIEYVEGLKAKIDNTMQQGAMNVRGQFGK